VSKITHYGGDFYQNILIHVGIGTRIQASFSALFYIQEKVLRWCLYQPPKKSFKILFLQRIMDGINTKYKQTPS